MKTIEERAILHLEYERDFLGNDLSEDMVRRAYVKAATDQKAIDEAKLLKLKSAWEKEAQTNHDDELNYKQGYHDAIEEACDWFGDYLTELRDSVNWFYGSSKMKSGKDRFMEAMKK